MERASRVKMTSMPESAVDVHRQRGFAVPRTVPIVPSQAVTSLDAPVVPNQDELRAPDPDLYEVADPGPGYESIGRSALRHPALIGPSPRSGSWRAWPSATSTRRPTALRRN